MKTLLQKILARLAMAILLRYEPTIVAVTGSVGKTSAVRAIAAVLSRSFSVRHSPKNFNNELGVPLTIMGAARSGGRSPFRWLSILMKGLRLAHGAETDYPKVLVLEMGADHPGDLARLTVMAKPDIAVVTAVSSAHTEFFGDIEGVAIEKSTLVEALDEDGIAVLNADDEHVQPMHKKTRGRTIFFGMGTGADVIGDDVRYEGAMGTFFTRFDLVEGGKTSQVTISEAIGIGNVYAALAAAAVAAALGADPTMTSYGLAEYHPPSGRLRTLPGIRNTVLIDDTYNSSPRAAGMALDVFTMLKPEDGGRKIAVLGDMLELGSASDKLHAEIGRKVAVSGIDMLIGVGPVSTHLCRAAVLAGMSEEDVFNMDSSLEAGKFLQDRIHEGDVILLKGSQGIRMEKAVKELMAEPGRSEELLVRQGSDWT